MDWKLAGMLFIAFVLGVYVGCGLLGRILFGRLLSTAITVQEVWEAAMRREMPPEHAARLSRRVRQDVACELDARRIIPEGYFLSLMRGRGEMPRRDTFPGGDPDGAAM